jgi:hypothetical protein
MTWIRRWQVSSALALLLTIPAIAAESTINNARWWPVQAMPKAIVIAKYPQDPTRRLPCEMMLQSVAGLAAKAVNEGHNDEMVWVPTNNTDEEDWFVRFRQRHPQLQVRGSFAIWDLVDRYAKQGLIKGYILYRSDDSKGEHNQHRPRINCSVNVATSLAGLLDGIIVDETLEKDAQAHGLKLLMDARDKTQSWCFEKYRDQFNRNMVCTQDPRKPNVRDLAIAQKAFTMYGPDDPTPAVMKWLKPLSPILGWNGGDERKTTELSTILGHTQTATDWCINLPVLMAGTETTDQPTIKDFDLRTIDWKDTRSAVSFISTDGDNVQFFEGSFFRSGESKNYWSNPDRGKIPFGWSCCFSQLAQLCPEAIDYASSTQSPNDWFVEWGGGYFYPDLFASSRPNRWDLLAQHARRTSALMNKSNTHIIGFNVTKFDSPDAQKAYKIIAAQSDHLQAILIFQYDRYEAGAGAVFWVKDRNGIDIPVITARYSIWEHQNARDRSGTPAKVAREIREAVEKTPADRPRYDWTIVHIWSWFKNSPGANENAENMPQENADNNGGMRGYAPAMWCAARLPSTIRTVSPAEMIWRLRMKHNPEQTTKLIHQWQP